MRLETFKTLGVKMKNRRYPVSVLALALLGLIIIVYGVLASVHADVSSYITFVGPIVTTLIGLAVVSQQVDEVRRTAEKIEGQTNGQLTERLKNATEDIKAHVDQTVKESSQS